MPFPVDTRFIEEAERELGLFFPPIYKAKMVKENGGEAGTDSEGWTLFPFFDKLDSKRISRTSNHIVLETRNAREWDTFPQHAVAIGENECGDYLILQIAEGSVNGLSDVPYSWWHETGEIHKVGETIIDLLEPNNE
jgi:hypothetical protein